MPPATRALLTLLALPVLAVLSAAACASAPGPAPASAPAPPSASAPALAPASPDFTALLTAPDRSSADRALDKGRRPAELFAFAGVKPGQRVAELGSWEGYTAELLARAVSPDGTVYAQDPPEFDKLTHAAWQERSKRAPYSRIVRMARPFEDPIAPGTPPLDVAFSILFYHDTVWLGVDRDRMNRAVFAALKPGGVLVVADHSARAGEGVRVAKSLHRIEETVVIDELQRAGFVLESEADLLRHPEDPRDWSASDEAPPEKRGTSDRFVLRFRKPG